MFAQPFQENTDYSAASRRPINYSQNLWKVDDYELHKPGERFISGDSPYLEAVIESGVSGPMESAPIPKGMADFVRDFVKTFGAVSSKYSSVEEVAGRVLSFLDFTEPYFIFVSSAVQLNSNQLKYTYRLKKGGSVLAPSTIECFNVSRSHTFNQYNAAREFINHPSVKIVLGGGYVKHKTEGRYLTDDDVLDKLSEILYGDPPSLRSVVEEWLFDSFENLNYRSNLMDEELLNLDSDRSADTHFWTVCAISVLMWLKSPYAIRFLAEYHPIYGALLEWDEKQGRVVVIPESGGEAIVSGWNVYTRADLNVEENSPPGTCESCKQTLHCTKFINTQALFHPVCSCGQLVPLEENNFVGHAYSGACKPYLDQYPPFDAFVCQRCMHMAVNQLSPGTTKCQRTSCPATTCPHHIGSGAYIRDLTKRRTMMLPHIRA